MFEFTKFCASNNDFILVDHRKPFIRDINALAAVVCRRRHSVGADGLILLENSEKADFRMRFLNPDGCEVEMCGNGSRAISLFAHQLGIIDKTGYFETPAGLIETEIINPARVRVKLSSPHSYREEISLELDGETRKVHFINTGVPHVVLKVDNVDNIEVKQWGREIRYADEFKPAGTNANFIECVDNKYVKIRTYERGVEDETLACGTGSAAGAIMACLLYGFESPVIMRTGGGEELSISFTRQNGQVSDVYLEGAVRPVFNGQYFEVVS